MSFDALDALRSMGHPIDLLSDAQRAVFATLTESEVSVLNSIKARLDTVAPEVEGHEVKIA
ncbi:aroma-sacti cluster domain-containing protein [Nonomuraea sp. NPDC046802]|uniref:aroma-sacti cluster domain-containing protein n=1 Tax=Nonomuraea sp. NPDC046802 TaxID=3154919 RepID=UPI00340E3110